MKRLVVFGMLLSGLLFSACKKENTDIDKGFSWNHYSAFYSQFLDPMKTSQKTYMLFYFSGIFTPPDTALSISADIEGDREPLALSINEQTIPFNDYYYSSSHNYSQSDTFMVLPNFYGKVFDFGFSDDVLQLRSDGSIVNPVANLAISKMLYPVVFENLSTDGKIILGTAITWTEDAANENGILIVMEYSPQNQSDPDNRINFPDYKKVGKVVEDNGIYTFAKSDFEGFPQNADLSFSLERVAYITFPDNNDGKCTFVNHEMAIAGFTISIEE